jgi:ubiquinone/menaquinone biosynthesis C-methylase UbiE
MAPCLDEGLIAGTAQEAVVAARNLGASKWASLARAWCVPYLFDGMEAIFDTGEEPVSRINRLLAELARFLNLAISSGFAELGCTNKGDLPQRYDSDIEDVTGEHYGRLFREFSPASYWDEPVDLLSLRLSRNEIDTTSLDAKEVLDAGCGGGRYTVAWRLLGAGRAVGIDLSPLNIADACERVRQAGIEQVEFKVGNVLDLPFADDSFDIVFSNGVLHHTLNWEMGVAELLRVLRPGGMGWLYLIEKPGGLFWNVIEVLRVIMRNERRDFARAALQILGIPANRIFYMLDHVMVPINVRLTRQEIEDTLARSGGMNIRRLTRGADFDRIEQIYQRDHYAEVKYGVGENRYVFSKG